MTSLRLIFKEIRHRTTNFLLSVLAVAVAVALLVAFMTAAGAAEREAARLMLSLGYNLHIIPGDSDIGQFLLTGIPDKTMPEEYLDKLTGQNQVTYNHLLASLQRKFSWQGMDVIVTGLAPEVCPPGEKKTPIGFQIRQGDLYVGYQVASRLELHEGQTVQMANKTFRIARCLAESGGIDDVRVQCHLRDAQDVLNLPGQISEIRAVDCLCFVPTDDPVSILRQQIAAVLPQVKVFHTRAIASIRAKTRQMIGSLFAVAAPLVIAVCGVWIGVQAMLNVRARRQEIGIMRALGHSSTRIAVLFLGKALIVGLVGATAGFLLGTALALELGPAVFKITAQQTLRPQAYLFGLSVVVAPVFAGLCSFIPAMIAVGYDPAVTLRDQ